MCSASVENGEVRIASVAVANPPCVRDQRQTEEFLVRNFGEKLRPHSRSAMLKVLAHPSVQQRHFAFDAPERLLTETRDERVARFTEWAVGLSEKAVADALSQAGVTPRDVSVIVVNTCTGYLCPGISSYLIERLGLPRQVRAYDLVGSGCVGAVPNLQLCEALARTNGDGAVVAVSVEICSATFQMGDDLSLIVSNALFGDGAGAAVLWRRPQGLKLIATAGTHVPEHREDIRYVYKDGQLHNQLSVRLPHIVRKPVAEMVRGLLAPHGLRPQDVKHWAIHSGGEKILSALQEEMELTDNQLRPVRHVLASCGNLSSATVWYVLREIMANGIAPDDWCLMVAFGAGFSAHGYLLRA